MHVEPGFLLHLVGYILPLVTILTAIPMAFGVVPPNRFYGFRTPRTLSSPEVWYPANRASGRYLTAASAISLVFNLTFWWTHAEWPILRLLLPMVVATVVPMTVSLIASLLYLRKL